MKNRENGFSLIELLVVIALISIVVTIGAFSYREVMRGYRVKHGLSSLYDSFVKAKAYAAYKNTDVTVSYNNTTGVVDFRDDTNNITVARIVFSQGSKDPNLRTDAGGNAINTYYFAPNCVIRSQTRQGNSIVKGLYADEDKDGTNDKTLTTANIPILSNAAISPSVAVNGFIDVGGPNISAILVMSQSDIDDPNADVDKRQYFLVLFHTGLIKKAQLETDGSGKIM